MPSLAPLLVQESCRLLLQLAWKANWRKRPAGQRCKTRHSSDGASGPADACAIVSPRWIVCSLPRGLGCLLSGVERVLQLRVQRLGDEAVALGSIVSTGSEVLELPWSEEERINLF